MNTLPTITPAQHDQLLADVTQQADAMRDWLEGLKTDLTRLTKQAAAVTSVSNEAEYQTAREVAKQWSKQARQIETKRAAITKPFLEAQRFGISIEKVFIAAIAQEQTGLLAAIKAYEYERDAPKREAAARISARRRQLTSLSDVYERAESFWLNATPLLTLWDVENLDDEAFGEEMERVEKVHADHVTTLRELEELARQRQDAPLPVTYAERAPYATNSAPNVPTPTANTYEPLRAKIAGILGVCGCGQKLEEIMSTIKPYLR